MNALFGFFTKDFNGSRSTTSELWSHKLFKRVNDMLDVSLGAREAAPQTPASQIVPKKEAGWEKYAKSRDSRN